MPCNTSCNQQKVVQEPEIQAPRGKEWQCGVGDKQATGSMWKGKKIMITFKKILFLHYHAIHSDTQITCFALATMDDFMWNKPHPPSMPRQQQSKLGTTPNMTAISTIKGIINRTAKVKWQREWDRAEVGRELHKIVPKIPSTKYISHTSKIV